jgi:hypothetical protein
MSKINIVLCNVIFKNYEGPQNSSPNNTLKGMAIRDGPLEK